MYPYITVFQQSISIYGLCYMLGIAVCYLFAAKRTRQVNLSTDHLLIIAAVAIGTAVSGAKVLYLAVTYSPKELLQFIKAGHWKHLISGGFVFYGGLAGGLLGAYLGAKIAGTPLMCYESAIVPFLPLGYGIGRVGCYFAGCCYGVLCCGIQFPVQLFDAAFSAGVCIYLVRVSRQKRCPYTLLLIYLSIYAVQRFLLEFLRGDTIRGSFGILSTSQWISLAVLLLCGALAWKLYIRNSLAREKIEENEI